MNTFLQKYFVIIFKEKIFRICGIGSILFCVVIAGIILLYRTKLSTPTILHFDALSGINLFGESSDLWMLFVSALFFTIINTVLARIFFYRERVLSYIFLMTNPIITFLTFISIVFVISIN